MVETGVSGETAEGHGRIDFCVCKGTAATGIRKAWRERERVRRGSRTEKGKGEVGNFDMLGRIQVMPRWADDPVRRLGGHWWRTCQSRRGLPSLVRT